MKKHILVVLVFCICCSQQEDHEAGLAVKRFSAWVDTVSMIKTGYFLGPDTEFVEVPVDPKDFSKIKVDTMVISIEEKKRRGFQTDRWKWLYEQKLKETEVYLNRLSPALKRELEKAKEKFQALDHR